MSRIALKKPDIGMTINGSLAGKVYETATECIESNGTKFNVGIMIKFCDTILDITNRLTSLYVGAVRS